MYSGKSSPLGPGVRTLPLEGSCCCQDSSNIWSKFPLIEEIGPVGAASGTGRILPEARQPPEEREEREELFANSRVGGVGGWGDFWLISTSPL